MAYGSVVSLISGAILWNPVIFFPAVVLTYSLTFLSGLVCDFIGWAFDRPDSDPSPPAGNPTTEDSSVVQTNPPAGDRREH